MQLSDKSDYKYQMHLVAEDIAMDTYGLEFHQLSEALQTKVFNEAMEVYWEQLQIDAERN